MIKYLSLKNIGKLACALIVILLVIVGIKYQKQIKRLLIRLVRREVYMNYDSSCSRCSVLFQDEIPVHEKAYQYEGIKPKNDFDDLQKLIENRTLIEIKTSEYYIVEPMGASLPALLPKGITFINKLSREYRALCDQKNIEYIPFRITSATRTIKSVKALMKDNGNAIENSAHLKGKTIDITYLTSKKHTKQKELFIQTLAKLKDQGLCYVKFEVKMKCLHITCR
jgi:hypothetical protein